MNDKNSIVAAYQKRRLGKYSVDIPSLLERAREIRRTKPECFSVNKLRRILKCSNWSSMTIYNKILREG